MIKSRLPVLMAERGIKTVTEVSLKTKITRNTLSALYNSEGKGIHYDTLERLCDYFECDVGDILRFSKQN